LVAGPFGLAKLWKAAELSLLCNLDQGQDQDPGDGGHAQNSEYFTQVVLEFRHFD